MLTTAVDCSIERIEPQLLKQLGLCFGKRLLAVGFLEFAKSFLRSNGLIISYREHDFNISGGFPLLKTYKKLYNS